MYARRAEELEIEKVQKEDTVATQTQINKASILMKTVEKGKGLNRIKESGILMQSVPE